MTIGLASALFSPDALILAGLIWTRLPLVVVRVEEPMLSRKLGEEYEVYRRTHRSLVPSSAKVLSA